LAQSRAWKEEVMEEIFGIAVLVITVLFLVSPLFGGKERYVSQGRDSKGTEVFWRRP
jgi:hypothetical protein